MLMTDKNGKEIKTGDIVKIENGYFKADNGTFLVKNSPGDPSWSGSDYSLRKCNKKGEESDIKYATAFWPLMVTVNSREKRAAAKRHNKENATIEIIGSVKVYELNVKQSRGWSDYEYKEIATEKRYQELLTYRNTEVEILSESVNKQEAELAVPVLAEATREEETTQQPEKIKEPATVKTSSGTYLLNKETQKIELHFEKSDYLALSDEQKKEIKSYFLWSRYAGAWVSRSTNNHYSALKIAEKLGLENAGKIGERLSYAEQLEVKAEKAEARAERYEQYANNAEARGKLLASALDKYRGDIAFFTQPIIAGHAGSRAFANYRERLYRRVEKGYEEYRKSEYYQDRAATARATADNVKLKDKVYLDNKIKECKKTLKAYQEHIVSYENKIYRIQQGEVLKSYKTGEPLTAEYYENLIEERLERYDYEQGKLDFFEDCLADLGGIAYSKENVKKGDMVKIRGSWGKVLSANPTTVRILNSLGWDWMKYPYSEIQDYKKADEAKAI